MKKIYLMLLISTISLGVMGQGKWAWVSNETAVLEKGGPDSFEDEGVGFPCVLQIDEVYHMWYAGIGSVWGMSIAHATSENGITWTKDPENPVLEKGLEDSWERDYVYLPKVLYVDGVFHMWYVGAIMNESESMGYATSTDGSTWTKHEGNPLGRIGGDSDWDAGKMGSGGMYHDGEKFHSWYSASSSTSSNFKMGYATSADGITWVRESDMPVMDHGEPGDWDYPRTQPSAVVHENGQKHIWYSGGDFSDWRIGHASSEDGLTWERDADNPVVNTVNEPGSGRELFVAFPSVIRDSADSILKMWYFGSGEGFSGSIYYAEYTFDSGTPRRAESQAGIRIYPNPTTNRVNFTVADRGSHSLSIITLNGQEVYSVVFGGDQLELDVSDFTRGMYMVRLNTGNQTITKKLILF